MSRMRILHFRPSWHSRTISSFAATPNPLPATFLRGGTSKGIFINRKHLPSDTDLWAPIFLRIMGSPDPVHARQLNGMGGGVSSLSKICVVGGKGSLAAKDDVREDVDVEYTFAQVGIRDEIIDYSGNCGNLSSMIGIFAVDEGICGPTLIDVSRRTHSHPRGRVRSFNTNTKKRIDTTFPLKQVNNVDPNFSSSSISTGAFIPELDIPEASVAGVPGLASRIDLDFVNPAGARTGKVFPTGNVVQKLDVTFLPQANESAASKFEIQATLIDATNPTVFIRHDDLVPILHSNLFGFSFDPPTELHNGSDINYSNPTVSLLIERIRRTGAEQMLLDPTAQAQPKIAIARQLIPTNAGSDSKADIFLTAFSMGVPHRAVPMTLGLCAGVAAGVKGTVIWDVVQQTGHARTNSTNSAAVESSSAVVGTHTIKVAHPSGSVDVGAVFDESDSREGHMRNILSARVVRTGRRLMRGEVWW